MDRLPVPPTDGKVLSDAAAAATSPSLFPRSRKRERHWHYDFLIYKPALIAASFERENKTRAILVVYEEFQDKQ